MVPIVDFPIAIHCALLIRAFHPYRYVKHLMRIGRNRECTGARHYSVEARCSHVELPHTRQIRMFRRRGLNHEPGPQCKKEELNQYPCHLTLEGATYPPK